MLSSALPRLTDAQLDALSVFCPDRDQQDRADILRADLEELFDRKIGDVEWLRLLPHPDVTIDEFRPAFERALDDAEEGVAALRALCAA